MKFNLTKDISTALKGLSCLLIVLHHWCLCLAGLGYHNVILDLIALRGGVTGVAVFFYLSSYGLTRTQQHKKDSLKVFFSKRLVKVYIPLVITNLLWLSVRYQGQGLVHSILQVLNLTDKLDGATWFCNVIIICYIIFYCSNSLKADWMKILCNWLLTLVFAAVLVSMMPNAPFVVYSLVAFPLGSMVALLQDKFNLTKLMTITFVPPLILLGIFASMCTEVTNQLIANMYCCIVILCMMLMVVWYMSHKSTSLSKILLPIAKPASFIGLYSYEIYLLHNKFLIIHGQYHISIWYPITFICVVIPLAIALFALDKKISKLVVR
jgi:peptidoglycan/LPS O-acetylase OafA/YrhL